MAKINRWLLPEGVEEILPRQAWQIEQYQRRVLDIYRSWGYELVIPPMIEYSESLLVGMGSEMDLQTFKLTDQMSGRTLAIRADITPQTARIDAHSYVQQGPTRLCYSGTVFHTKPKSQLASREPLEVGAELYGDASIYSDHEVISLMLTTIAAAGIDRVHLDLGHVGIYRALIESAGISGGVQSALLDAFNRKAKTEIAGIVAEEVSDAGLAAMINALVGLHGELAVLDEAKSLLSSAPQDVLEAIEYVQAIASRIAKEFPDISLNIDLAELRGYQYHTGLVFAAYVEGVGHAVANGGRYDDIGKVFGRSRPATGFSANVKDLLSQVADCKTPGMILAPAIDDTDLVAKVAELRQQGERVVNALSGNEKPVNCTKELVKKDGAWQIQPIAP